MYKSIKEKNIKLNDENNKYFYVKIFKRKSMSYCKIGYSVFDCGYRYFLRLMRKERDEKKFIYYNKYVKLWVFYLIFVNNPMFYCEGDRRSVNVMIEIVGKFVK